MTDNQKSNKAAKYPQPYVSLQKTLKLNNMYLSKVVNNDSFITRASYYDGDGFKHVDSNGEIISELEYHVRDSKEVFVVSEYEVVIL